MQHQIQGCIERMGYFTSPPHPIPQAQGGMINISAFDNMELLSIIWKERNVYTLACVQEQAMLNLADSHPFTPPLATTAERVGVASNLEGKMGSYSSYPKLRIRAKMARIRKRPSIIRMELNLHLSQYYFILIIIYQWILELGFQIKPSFLNTKSGS